MAEKVKKESTVEQTAENAVERDVVFYALRPTMFRNSYYDKGMVVTCKPSEMKNKNFIEADEEKLRVLRAEEERRSMPDMANAYNRKRGEDAIKKAIGGIF